MYTSGYSSSNYSLASAVSLVAFALTLALSAGLLMLDRKRVHYQ